MFYPYNKRSTAESTGQNPLFPISLKDRYLFLSVRLDIAGRLLNEAVHGLSSAESDPVSFRDAAENYAVHQDNLAAFVEENLPSQKTQEEIVKIIASLRPGIDN
jgi:hypothetical protein